MIGKRSYLLSIVERFISAVSFSKINAVRFPFIVKPFAINYILKYYATNIIVWMFSYFILGSLQLHKPGLSSEFIKMNISYSIWSGIFHGIIWGSIFIIIILLRDKLTSYYGILFFSVLANIISTLLMVYCNFHIDELVNFEDMPQTISQLYQFYKSQMFYVLVLHTFLTALLFQFVYEMDRKLGQGVLLKFLLGRYHKPTEEKRVFLFMDLKSSTHYAEQLGHFKYSRLIQDCFNDLSASVLKNKAQIYQFVGDEVVLTWEINRNFNAKHCMQCFVDFTNKLASKKEYYMNQYGMLPEFKAGLHAGKVMVAQVGQLKSEIAYHGDAINTASRIQALCNHYQSFLLFSNDFLTLLTEKQVHTIKYQSIGPVAIKGKNKLVDLYRLVIG
jgi:adenylate cyclase